MLYLLRNINSKLAVNFVQMDAALQILITSRLKPMTEMKAEMVTMAVTT